MMDALADWASICSPTNPIDCDDCEDLIITWARKQDEMRGYPDKLAIAYQPSAGVAGWPCKVDCEQSRIILNGTNEFMDCDPDKDEVPDYSDPVFFYTNKNMAHKDDVNWYHFRSVILHEIGHWLGLGDIGGNCIPVGANNNTVMWSTLSTMQERDVLSDIDKCMFMLLYCCDPMTNVEEEITQLDYELIIKPNPVNNVIKITYNLDKSSNVSLFLLNNLGQLEQIIAVNQNQINGIHEVILNTNQLASGSYRIFLKVNQKMVSKKLVITK